MSCASRHTVRIGARIPEKGAASSSFILVVALLALVASMGAGWTAWNAVVGLRDAETRLNSTVTGSEGEKIRKLQAQLEENKARVNELAMVVEGPMGHLANAYEQDVEALRARLSELELEIAAVRQAKASIAVTDPPPSARMAGGQWVVHLTSSREKGRAEQDLARARAAGYTARLTTGEKDGRIWYRVTIAQTFATADDARAFTRSAAKAGFLSAWAAKR